MSLADDRGPDPAAAILPSRDFRDLGLVFTVAVLSFLACIAVIAALAADRAAQGWARQLSGSATVQVRPLGGETGAEAAARAAEAVAGVKGVSEARAMDRKKIPVSSSESREM